MIRVRRRNYPTGCWFGSVHSFLLFKCLLCGFGRNFILLLWHRFLNRFLHQLLAFYTLRVKIFHHLSYLPEHRSNRSILLNQVKHSFSLLFFTFNFKCLTAKRWLSNYLFEFLASIRTKFFRINKLSWVILYNPQESCWMHKF